MESLIFNLISFIRDPVLPEIILGTYIYLLLLFVFLYYFFFFFTLGVFIEGDGCPLQHHVPETYYFELRSADELDELLICDLPEIAALDNYTEAENFARGQVWILKPSIMNQAREIHVIASTKAFVDALSNPDVEHVREWVIQKYVSNPLLLSGGRKFHIRAHVVAVGNCTVYLMDRMLALFSLHAYEPTVKGDSVHKHITNVCYQKGKFIAPNGPDGKPEPVPESKFVLMLDEAFTLWAKEQREAIAKNEEPHESQASQGSLPAYKYFSEMITKRGEDSTDSAIAQVALNHISEQIRVTLCESFAAGMGIHHTTGLLPDISKPRCAHSPAAPEEEENNTSAPKISAFRMSNYTPLENCAELYGVDFMVDETFKVSLLEFNAGPDFGQTGERLKDLAIRPLISGMTSVIMDKIFPSLSALDEDKNTDKSKEREQNQKTQCSNGSQGESYVPMSCPGAGFGFPGVPAAPHFVPIYHVDL